MALVTTFPARGILPRHLTARAREKEKENRRYLYRRRRRRTSRSGDSKCYGRVGSASVRMWYDYDKTLCISTVTIVGGWEREREKNVTVLSYLVLAKFYPEPNDTPNQV